MHNKQFWLARTAIVMQSNFHLDSYEAVHTVTEATIARELEEAYGPVLGDSVDWLTAAQIYTQETYFYHAGWYGGACESESKDFLTFAEARDYVAEQMDSDADGVTADDDRRPDDDAQIAIELRTASEELYDLEDIAEFGADGDGYEIKIDGITYFISKL